MADNRIEVVIAFDIDISFRTALKLRILGLDKSDILAFIMRKVIDVSTVPDNVEYPCVDR